MTTSQRIRLLASVAKQFPELGKINEKKLRELLCLELGHPEALDRAIPYGSHSAQAIAPRCIYHVCAGNLAVSSWSSIFFGLLLGSDNIVKISRAQEKEIRYFVRQLPFALRKKVSLENEMRSITSADAVIVFGRDETISQIRSGLRSDQTFLGYGHQVSLLWIAAGAKLAPALLRACAYDASVYDQMGCLSPHVIYVENGRNLDSFCSRLANAMEYWRKNNPPRALSIAEASSIVEARDVARALSKKMWCSADPRGWTVILDLDPTFSLSCLHRTIYVKPIRAGQMPHALQSIRGHLSTVGCAGKLSVPVTRSLVDLGAKRFCPAGQMQHPPLTWHHDGRPNLGDLVKWVDWERSTR